MSLGRDHRVEQDAGATQRLEQGVEHGVEPARRRLVLGQLPRLGVGDVLVRLAHGLHHALQGAVELQLVELTRDSRRQLGERLAQVDVDRLHVDRGRHHAVAVAAEHAERAVEQVAEVVRQIGVDALGDGGLGEAGVEAVVHVAHQEVAERVVAVLPHQVERPHHVAQRLAHLPLVVEPVAVHVEVLVDGDAGSLEHDRPEQAVRLEDVLGDEVLDVRPVALDRPAVDQGRVVVDERVEPDVGDVLLVPRQRDAPRHALARTADGEVADRLAQHRQHLVAVALRADQVGLLVEQVVKPGAVLLHAEEVVGLGAVLRLDLVLGALAVDQLLLRVVALALHAVEAGVLAVDDVAGVVDALQHLAHDLLVALLGGADEVVVADAEAVPGGAELPGDVVGVRLRRLAVRLSGLLDVLAVLVGAREEEGVVALEAVEARDDVDQDRGVRVTHVRRRVDVEDRRGGVERAAAAGLRAGLDGRLALHQLVLERRGVGGFVDQRGVGDGRDRTPLQPAIARIAFFHVRFFPAGDASLGGRVDASLYRQ